MSTATALTLPRLPEYAWDGNGVVEWLEGVMAGARSEARRYIEQTLQEAANRVLVRQLGRDKHCRRRDAVAGIAAVPCPRCGTRLTTSFVRKGSYARTVVSLVGEVQLRLPRVMCVLCRSNVPLRFPFLRPRSRLWLDIRKRVVELFAMRVSYRDIAGFLERETGWPVSRYTLRCILSELTAAPGPVVWWQPGDPVPVEVQLDGVWLKVKGKLRILLLALDTTAGRPSRLLGWHLAPDESSEAYYALTYQLKKAGVTLQAGLQVVVSDGAPGIHQAIISTWPEIHHQHCHWHCLQRLRDKVANPQHQAAIERDARHVLTAATGAEGLQRARVFLQRWAKKEPRAAAIFRRLARHAFTFLKLPRTVVSRASGKVERLAREFRRKYRQMETFRSPRYVAPTVLAWAVRHNAAGDPNWPSKLLSRSIAAHALLGGMTLRPVLPPPQRWSRTAKRPGGSIPGEKHGRRFGPKPTSKPLFPRWF